MFCFLCHYSYPYSIGSKVSSFSSMQSSSSSTCSSTMIWIGQSSVKVSLYSSRKGFLEKERKRKSKLELLDMIQNNESIFSTVHHFSYLKVVKYYRWYSTYTTFWIHHCILQNHRSDSQLHCNELSRYSNIQKTWNSGNKIAGFFLV